MNRGPKPMLMALVATTVTFSGCSDGGSLTPVGKAELGATTAPAGADRAGDSGTQGNPGEPGDASSGSTAERPTTTVPPATPDASLNAAVSAYRAELGETIRALELTVWFPESGSPYAELQSQDPANPANVDSRSWRNGRIADPEPVVLTGGGSLEENLFAISEINWSAIAANLAGAPALVEQKLATTIENGTGVTHLIATKDLPFSPNTVVRVYVDGGDRTTGGYVQYLADGSLDKVQA